jgi:hypothetical protein
MGPSPTTARGRSSFFTRSSSEEELTGAFAGQLLHRIRTQIGNYDLMPAAHQTARHVRAHAAQTYHSQLHSPLLLELELEVETAELNV